MGPDVTCSALHRDAAAEPVDAENLPGVEFHHLLFAGGRQSFSGRGVSQRSTYGITAAISPLALSFAASTLVSQKRHACPLRPCSAATTGSNSPSGSPGPQAYWPPRGTAPWPSR